MLVLAAVQQQEMTLVGDTVELQPTFQMATNCKLMPSTQFLSTAPHKNVLPCRMQSSTSACCQISRGHWLQHCTQNRSRSRTSLAVQASSRLPSQPAVARGVLRSLRPLPGLLSRPS